MKKLYAIIGHDANGHVVGFSGDNPEPNRIWIYQNSFSHIPTEFDRKYARYKLRQSVERISFKPTYIVDAYTHPNSANQCEWFFVRQLADELNRRQFKNIRNWIPVRLNSKSCPIEIDMKLRNKVLNNKKRIKGLTKSDINRILECPTYWEK